MEEIRNDGQQPSDNPENGKQPSDVAGNEEQQNVNTADLPQSDPEAVDVNADGQPEPASIAGEKELDKSMVNEKEELLIIRKEIAKARLALEFEKSKLRSAEKALDEVSKERMKEYEDKLQNLELMRGKLRLEEQKSREELEQARKFMEEQLHNKKQESESQFAEELIRKRKELADEIAEKRTDLVAELSAKIEKTLEEQTELRGKIEQELRSKKENMENYIREEKEKRMKELEDFITNETFARKAKLEEQLAIAAEAAAAKLQEEKNAWEVERRMISEEKERLNNLKAELEEVALKNAFNKKMLDAQAGEIEQSRTELNEEVERRMAERAASYRSLEESRNQELQRLREVIRRSDEAIGLYEELKRRLGDDEPEKILLRLNQQEQHIQDLRKELLERPTEEMRNTYDRLVEERDALRNTRNTLQQEMELLKERNAEAERSKIEASTLTTQITMLKNYNDSLKTEYERVCVELKKLQAAYEVEQDREERIKLIETPHFRKEEVNNNLAEPDDEIAWLEGIRTSSAKFGLRFPRRILYAFHTALKTAEWSPLTVLAGVSGTGKSELPRLYSHFGGFNYHMLSVQPNWDSQESMLGFFNSIINKFDAQPVLQLLAQSQKRYSEDYPGLFEQMNLILLDEMNLAHVELYFAEFLSKLEQRRGTRDIISLPVKLGACMDPYLLPLGRNVLWAGTMNQDETTKSLSDKVIDRGIIINFPRPVDLVSRKKLTPLPEPAQRLSRKTWQSWWCKESLFNSEEISPYKEFIEEMNGYLANAGRAIGHRVWQSLEFYMSNYPLVQKAKKDNDEPALEAAMLKAFEDQLVQKVMPKLKGIDTKGSHRTKCLDKIQGQLEPFGLGTLVEDFQNAIDAGYGQFTWHTANYILDDEAADNTEMVQTDGAEVTSEN